MLPDSFIFLPHNETIKQLIQNHYTININSSTSLGGHSNLTFKIIDTENATCILRLSKPAKNSKDLEREEYILNSLEDLGYTKAPQIVKTIENKGHLILNLKDQSYSLQIFNFIPGEVKYKWHDKSEEEDLKPIFNELAILHTKLQQIPNSTAFPEQKFEYNLNLFSESILVKQPTGTYLLKHHSIFVHNAKKIMNEIEILLIKYPQNQYIHGDIHLENIIFNCNNVTAILDFEYACYGNIVVDIIFSAFRICKYGLQDDHLYYDVEGIKIGLTTYSLANKKYSFILQQFMENEKLWKAFFALDQAFLYINKAASGIWQLQEKIGFLPCFNEVIKYEK